ncbi:glycosyltransferase [Caproicibacter sp.]|uniref:glycosyltransferase n=1 Tax=Caproicibacter sp. TaxID=2814884 RepID=UPI00398A0A93
MSISLCMIVKNEEENLTRCLNSVKDLVSEMILVDTGSTDRTVSIAREFGASVFSCPWNDSFSDARNYALSKAAGSWILVMDADEELEPEDQSALLALAQHKDGASEVCCCKTLCYSGAQADCCNLLVTMNIRLIRNGKGYRYAGRVHEQLTGPEGPPRMTASGVRFYHYGYLSSQIEKKDKHGRNIALIQKELEESPGNGFMLFNLGNEYLALGKTEDAMDCYRESYRTLDPAYGYGTMLLTRMILCCEQLGRDEDQAQYIRDGLRLYPRLTDFEYLRACMLHRQGKLLKAVRSCRRCIRMGPPPSDMNSVYGVSSFKPYHRLSVLYEQLGEPELALRYCRKAIRLNPRDREAFARMAYLLFAKGCTPVQVQSRLLRLSEKDFCSFLMLSDLFYDRRMYRQALQFAVRAQKWAPACCCAVALYDEGVCRFFLGQYRRAYRCLSRTPEVRANSRAAFFCVLCSLLDPSAAPVETDKLPFGLSASDIPAATAFRALLKGESCPPLNKDQQKPPGCADSVFGLLEILLRGGLLNEFTKAVQLLNQIDDRGILVRLGKLCYRYGYAELACRELKRSICVTGEIDAEGLSILSKTLAAAAKG